MMIERLGAVFMPHGLGHFLGIDTHDPGGYLKVLVANLSAEAPLSIILFCFIFSKDWILTETNYRDWRN
jgi:hypothetical protein